MNNQFKLFVGLCALFGVIFITATHQIEINKSSKAVIESEEPIVEFRLDQTTVECLALNLYHEARGEGAEGKLAVAHVTLNRVNHSRYPNTVCEVVYQAKVWTNSNGESFPIRDKCHFSWYCDGRDDTPRDYQTWGKSVSLAVQVLLGETQDPTEGATHYYNPNKVDPYWSDSYQQVASIGNHLFLK